MELAIVGAGAAAACLLDTLSRQRTAPDRLLVLDPGPYRWRGRPYQKDLDEVRVNLPPQQMSARHGDDTHFAKWLESGPHGGDRYLDELLGRPLPPRWVYGEYLAETAEAALATLRSRGCVVELVRARVTEVTPAGRLQLRTADGDEYQVDRAALCVGSGSPRDLYGLTEAPGFVLDPYPLAETVRSVGADDDVAVIGSGLTAVDVVVALAARGHRGRVRLLSRRGVLPFVQQRGFPFQPRHLTRDRLLALAEERGPLGLDHLMPLFRAELAGLGEELQPLAAEIAATETEPPVDRLRRQLAEVDSEQRARRVLVRLIRALGPLALRLLAERDRKELQEVHFRTVSSLCSPMVPVNASVLLGLCDRGRLELVQGVRRIVPRADRGFSVDVGDMEFGADVVVNAVNSPPYAAPESATAVLRSLVGAGAAEFHQDGGLHTEPGTGRLVVGGRPDHRLYALGDIAGANLFITSSIAGLVAQTAGIAAAVMAS
ncbi:FAD/NAD(P)-binding protein [Streptantibioticus rubrisoli]|uniref:FAD/NAD(P)-binding protein n=1 Tax=Streptantibioticus rubrisoli TaxID=1387313 RepID=A0ABT1P9I6_9ACTN|nr:FAD/NAD(P)-binding protein [Streptantibioticus rubrisoli]MCQ4041461.1 FAD/NAD(P)-binding protein [Streptantibioticus rubrisoli]